MDLVTTFVALFTIANPIGNAPVFLAATSGQSTSERRRSALVITGTVVVVLLVALFLGRSILGLFGIELDAFRLAGQLVIASIAWTMLRKSSAHAARSFAGGDDEDAPSPVVVPLSIPMIAGPGSIMVVITAADHATSVTGMLPMVGVIAALAVAVLAVLMLSPYLARLLGANGLQIMTRIFGLLLLAIAFSGAASTLRALFPGLAGG